MKNTREIRARASIERRELTAAEKSAGYIGAIRGVIPFNSDSQVITKRGRAKPFVEQIAPEAFKRSLAEDRDIMANAGHTEDPLAALGRIGENLTVTTDDRAMTWEAMVPDTKAGRDMLTLVEKKIIRGTSFEFEVRGEAGEKWEKRDDRLDQRTITDARLIAFNPVAWPAYTDTSLTVELRRSARALAAYAYDDMDEFPPTDDVSYAQQALATELQELQSAQDYLRENPQGLLAEYANSEVGESSDAIKQLVDFIAAHGTERAETDDAGMAQAGDMMARARKKLAEVGEKNFPHNADHDRERRFRLIKLSSA